MSRSALIYLVVSSVLSSLQARLEKRFSRYGGYLEARVMIALDDIDKRFGDNHVLKGVSLVVAEGGVTALIGPSGSGKSTLLRCVNLLEIPQSGDVRIDDASGRLHARQQDRPRRHPGAAAQDRHGVPELPALPAPDGARERHGRPGDRPEMAARTRRARARSNCSTRSAWPHKADAWPANLSGGQQQRVAIARALAPSPQVLLCDEPTSALDPELAVEVVEVLAQLAREGTTMLMATHDLRLASSIANNVVFLDGGDVVETGPARQVFSAPAASGPSASSRRSRRRSTTAPRVLARNAEAS